jgi:hypothetical protein
MGRFPNPGLLGLGFCSFFGAFLFTYVQLGVFSGMQTLSFNIEMPAIPTISLDGVRNHVASIAEADIFSPSDGVVQEEIRDTGSVAAVEESVMPSALPTPAQGVIIHESVPVEAEAIVESVSVPEVGTEVEVLGSMNSETADLGWKKLQTHAPWIARDSGASFVFRDRLWYMGGLNGDGLPGEDHVVKYWEATYFNDIWSSKDGSEWRVESTHAPWSPRRSMSVAPLNGTLFMYGGWSQTEGYVSDIWYSADGYTWLLAPTTSPWSAREGQTLEFFDGKLWLMGGVNYDERKVFNDVWYSEDGLHWKEAPMASARWSGRWDHATAVFDESLYLVGGMDLSGNTLGDVWKSTDGVMWTNVSELPGATRQGHGLVSYKGELWTIGRLNDIEGGGENDVWHSKDGVVWNQDSSLPPWIGREDHAVHVLNGAIYVYGGMSADWVWMNDVWKGESSL